MRVILPKILIASVADLLGIVSQNFNNQKKPVSVAATEAKERVETATNPALPLSLNQSIELGV